MSAGTPPVCRRACPQLIHKDINTYSCLFFVGLFWKVHLMDPMTYAALFTGGTLVAAYLVAFAYKNTKFTLKHKIAQKRETAIAREVRNQPF